MDVDLRSVSLEDAKAARLALQYAVDSGMYMEPETYVSVVAFKAMLTYRIKVAEKTALPTPPPVLVEPHHFNTRDTSPGSIQLGSAS